MKPEKGASSFFQLALAARSELHKQFGNEQPINDHRNHFKKKSFPFYVYCYPLNATITTTLAGRGYSVMTDSINHPKICCPVAQCQFETLKEIGLLQWSITNKSCIISPQSYSWQLGDSCLDANCTTKTVKNQLIRRVSFCEDNPNSDDGDSDGN